MQDNLKAVEFDKVLRLAQAHCDTTMGREALMTLSLIPDPDVLHRVQNELREMMQLLDSTDVTLEGAISLEGMLKQVGKGGRVRLVELIGLRRTLYVATQMQHWSDPRIVPLIGHAMETLSIPHDLLHAIERIVNEEGDIRDDATPILYRLRRSIRDAEVDIDDTFARILRSQSWASALQDTIVTVRMGRRVIPIKHTMRNRVQGIVHDQSSSGQTVFVEPLAVIERQNRLTELRRQEEMEIDRILEGISQHIQKNHAALANLEKRVTWFDSLLARVRFGRFLGGVIPNIHEHGTFHVIDARHPLIEQPVPITVTLTGEKRIVLVTGPNTGGKTVVLKTVGLMAAMALSGMMVPCREETAIPFLTAIWADIGDEQSLEQSLSTFSSHLTRLVPMLEEANAESLCLVDEIGAGTDPDEGAALAEALIGEWMDKHAYAVITTHFSRLKLLGFDSPVIENAQVEFDRTSLKPTYRLVMGQPGSSQAFYIARRYGLSESVVERARGLMNPLALQLGDAIAHVNEIEGQLRMREQAIAARELELERASQKFARTQQQWEDAESKAVDKMRAEWHKKLENWGMQFDTAIKSVRIEEGKERARAVEALRDTYRQIQSSGPHGRRKTKSSEGTKPLEVGAAVKVQGFGEPGTILQIEGQLATVQMGSLRMKLQMDDLTRDETHAAQSKSRSRPSNTLSASTKALNSLSAECDLRGLTVMDAQEQVDKYLDHAILAGAPFVRIIHGKGTGALRRAITEQLAHDPRVAQYRLGGAGEGGDGVTVVAFDAVDSW